MDTPKESVGKGIFSLSKISFISSSKAFLYFFNKIKDIFIFIYHGAKKKPSSPLA